MKFPEISLAKYVEVWRRFHAWKTLVHEKPDRPGPVRAGQVKKVRPEPGPARIRPRQVDTSTVYVYVYIVYVYVVLTRVYALWRNNLCVGNRETKY